MTAHEAIRLGVNLDHVASLREARHTPYPDLMEAMRVAEAAGADGITLHPREDRRHVQPADVYGAREAARTPLNLEMAATEAMLALAVDLGPPSCCLVPERRAELTTEGGLDLAANRARLAQVCQALGQAGIRVSLFIEPTIGVVDAARELGAPVIELHTGAYATATGKDRARELERVAAAARHAHAHGLQVNAGHGLTCDNVAAIAAIPEIVELNIGHAIVARALFVGLEAAVREMRTAMRDAREAARRAP